jgi:hypothetical protein
MPLRQIAPILVITACAFAAGCDRTEPVKVELRGDSIGSIAKTDYPGGVSTTECAFRVRAVAVGGDAGDTVRLGGGRIVYTVEATGDTLISRPLDAASAASFWDGDVAVIPAGDSLRSKRQGISMSTPIQPLRAFVTIDYTSTRAEEQQTTAPFTVVCR